MLTNAFNTATAGLQALQIAIGTVSQNVANAGTAGYVKRAVSTISSDGGNFGVAAARIDRVFEDMALRQLRHETSQAAYTSVKSDILGQIDRLYGKPGDSTALDARLNGFAQALQGLSANPASAGVRNTVLSAASVVADKLRGTAAAVEDLRGGIAKRLAGDISVANSLLASIASLNAKTALFSDDAARAGILDRRDREITQLSQYFDVRQRTERDGSVTLMTNSGVSLVEHAGAASLSFDGRGELGSGLYPSKRSVGTITATLPGGGTVDLDRATFSSGSVAAGLELRDLVLPQAQRRLDDLAFGLAQAFTDKTVGANQDKSGFGLRLSELANMKAGNTITISVGTGEAARSVILVASNLASTRLDASQTVDAGARAQTFTIPASPATSQAYADAISAALSVAAPDVTVASSGADAVSFAGAGVQRIVAAITQPKSAGDLSSGHPRIALFVDGAGNGLVTGSFDDVSQRIGLAERISINAALKADTAPLGAVGAATTAAGASRPQFLYDALTSAKQSFSSASGIGGALPYSATVLSFAQDVVAAQGSEAAEAKTLNEQQSVAKASAETWFSRGASVNIDEEMSRLVGLQTAYAANARVMTAVREMLDTLLRA